MTERIDHEAEALNLLRATTIDTYGDDDRKVAIAQVHATLALVEQQRIANRIALASREWDIPGGGTMCYDILDSNISNDGQVRLVRLDPEIAAGLRLVKEEA